MFLLGSTFLVYLRFEGPQGHFGSSFWELFGYLGRHFGDLGGSWELVGILMYFRTTSGTTQVQGTWSDGAYPRSPGSS